MASTDQGTAAAASNDDAEASGGESDLPRGGGASDGGPATAGGTAPRRRRSDRLDLPRAMTVALGVAAGLVLAQLVAATAARLRSLLILILISLFLSFAMEPAVQWLDNRGVRRGLGTAVVFLGVTLLGVAMAVSVYGLVTDQVANLVDAAPRLIDQLARQAQDLPAAFAEPVGNFLDNQASEVPQRISDIAGFVGRSAVGIGSTVLGVVASGLAVLLVTFYLVADGPKLRHHLSRRLEPHRQKEFLRVWELAIAKTGGYVYSRLLLAVLSATVHIVAFTVADLPYAVALGIWVGIISSVVPVVGLYLAGTLPVVVSLAEPGASVLVVLGVIVVYQQVENYFVQPKVTAETMSLHPAVAFLSVIAGAALLGPAGALLALPAAAIVAALLGAYAEEHDVMVHELTTTGQSRPSLRANRGDGSQASAPSQRDGQQPEP